MKKGVVAALALASIIAATSRAHAEEWLGLFERHGIAPPADAKRARGAARAARRLGVQCWELGDVRGGGSQSYSTTCLGGARELAALGKDAAAAILDELDRPSLTDPTFDALVGALGRTGREDGVPVLVTALERMAARSALTDDRVRGQGRDGIGTIERELEALTFADPNELAPWADASGASVDDALLAVHARAWRAWLGAHPTLSRAAWKSAAIADARAAIAGPDHDKAFLGARRLTTIAETRAEGIAALRALPKRAGWPAKKAEGPLEWILGELTAKKKKR